MILRQENIDNVESFNYTSSSSRFRAAADPDSSRQHFFYIHDIFSFTSLRTRSDFHPAACFASSIKSVTRKSDRPAATATNGSNGPISVQFIGKECKRPSFVS
jgi:hypothetical protein